MARRGRPTVLDDAKRGKILAILSLGCSQTLAANIVGCSRSTIRREVHRNPEFGEAMRRAASSVEAELLRFVRLAAKKEQHWRAATWALERLFPERYARRGPDVITVEQLRNILNELTERVVQLLPDDRHRQAIAKDAEMIARHLGQIIGEEKRMSPLPKGEG